MDKLSMLKQISFGARVAEEETNELVSYFVETDQWTRINKGDIDIVRGDKGAGKSAIYSLLISRTDSLFDRNVLLVPAEKPRGATVFKDLEADPPTSEQEFVGLWKLYIVTLIAQKIREYDIGKAQAKTLMYTLEDAGLLQKEVDLSSILRTAQSYVRRIFRVEGVEGGVMLDPLTGMPSGLTGKITFHEPNADLRAQGFLSVNSLLRTANAILEENGYNVWLLLDRLDVAFAENTDLETNALRALFRVYLDTLEFANITLKIFLRSDIWQRITLQGFREASHITRYIVLEWNGPALLNLVVRRVLSNEIVLREFGFDKDIVLRDFENQKQVFERLFPSQVDQGTRKPSTFDWMVSRCADATGKTAPRELIHLLGALREKEIARLERGEETAPQDHLFDRSVFKEALPTVSEARLIQNLYAEYPEHRPYLVALTGEKTEQTVDSLAQIWNVDRAKAHDIATRLAEIGFFQVRGSRDEPTFWVPFIYRDALKLSQGLADE